MGDPGIKLFGKKIVLPEIDLPVISTAGEVGGGDRNGASDHTRGLLKDCLEGKKGNREAAEKGESETKTEGKSCPEAIEESENPNAETREEKSEPKTLKKPDKILPCPRCTSMDTKFCYYNNYNVNQPRHFCKSCQRYWTAGGAMRKMPVGAGRRKNKNSASHGRYITISREAFKAAAGVEVTAASDRVNGGSTVTTSASVPEKDGFHSKLHCIPGVSWPYNPWNSRIQVPAVCPPVPIYPSTYWNCIPFLPAAPSTPAQSPASHPCDPILGKRSVDDALLEPRDCDQDLKKPKNSVLIPKTLRIDDPDEAAKSSIWATLGIKNDYFKAFQEKGQESKKHAPTTSPSPVLQANPAAFSRSLCFQETA